MNFYKPYTINCDLGEGIPNEPHIIPWIDVASVACGGHFGDRDSIAASLELVQKFGKKAGAHPSYPDLQHFGRKSLNISPDELILSLSDQITLFKEVASEKSMVVDHIKFHGALYNDAAANSLLANLLVQFLKENHPNTPLFVPPHSELEKAALQHQLSVRLEIFGDRAYDTHYRLISRDVQNSLFSQVDDVMAHLESILHLGQIKTYSGEFIPVKADTICFHGDNPGILKILSQVRHRFWN